MPKPLPADKSAATQPPVPPEQPTASRADDQTGGLPVPVHSGHDSLDFLAPAQGADELGRLAHYRVLKELGRGGMGCVLLAEDTKLQRQVALKVMLPRFAEDATAKERFLREARAAAKIHHDNVITIFQVDEVNGVPFIALEFLQGAPLDKYLKDKGSLPLPIAVRIAREMAEGLSAAHKQGLIHRDIKPGNVWLEAPKGRVKLLDFGLARTEADDTHLTQSGAIVGTPAFMAPEQARGEKVDGRCDLFSLGVVLYRLTTGKQPFAGPTTIAVLTAIAVDTPAPPRSLNPKIPEALEKVIVKLLEKDPVKRYASAKELIPDLNEVLKVLAQAKTVEPATEAFAWVAAPGGRGSKRWPKILVAAALGFFAIVILAWQIVIRIQNKDGSETKTAVNSAKNVIVEKDGKKVGEVPIPPQGDTKTSPPPPDKRDNLPATLTVDLGGAGKMEFVLLNAKGNATFQMGSPPDEKYRLTFEKAFDAEKQHPAEITKPFYLAKYPVTQEQYRRVMGANPSSFQAGAKGAAKVIDLGTSRLPVEWVSWINADDCCKEMMKKYSDQLPAALRQPRFRFALPTEAQWEYACRAGTTTAYFFGDDPQRLGEYAWFDGNSAGRPHPVGEKKANRWALHDMNGNVGQWCEDYYGPYNLPVKDPLRSVKHSDELRILRGGSWSHGHWGCRAAYRVRYEPVYRGINVGFRVAFRLD